MLIFVLNCFKGYSQDTIYWKSCYKLKWEDFLGKPDTISSFEAITSSGIDYKYFYSDTSFSFTVKSFFDKKNSWKASSANLSTLKHEQLHFDITELYARLFRKRLSEQVKTSADLPVMRTIGKEIMKEWQLEENKYDLETKHSIDEQKQAEWALSIQKRLDALQAFSSK